ncbi:GH92 family glycosyl hydrolase [Flagellimonas nanhaiensis]|uniref:Glycoside hydrolase family 92 protein n=1 Tax=Flagellimonas nanhaiensis TaxID=2292706 RepID=A0A371JSV1_9FLAO|nr:GH92 family glycosyl hydrolase [Allomuricauda nanhaiensis]RDY60866.1 glycoside hydrolase family 92 protein [Allomuricauda nanhaiensis]
MIRYVVLIGMLSLVLSCKDGADKNSAAETLSSYVNPFIGTDGPGNTYPGATSPFGMVQLSPDIGIPGWDRIAGYYYKDSIITGFSHTHLTGTGAGDLYDILVMPVNNRFSERIEANNHKPFSHFDHNREGASPGYYWVDLVDFGIKAEMTATPRVGVHRYTFPKAEDSKIHVDLGYSLNWDKPTDTHIEVVNDSVIRGHRFSTGWARNQRLFFEMQFSKPFQDFSLTENGNADSKIVLDFETHEGEQITLKTGLSSANVEGAAKAIAVEAKGSFDTIRERTEKLWENELQKIIISTKNKDQKAVFYSMLYQSMLAPTLYSDVNGAYKMANDVNGLFKNPNDTIAMARGFNRYDTFSLWDTYRAAHPLYTIVQPERVSDMVKSLLAHYLETGILPVWSMQGSETNMMIGYHAVPVIVDAYFKGFEFDAELAYKACKQSAMVNERNIGEYMEKGYISVDEHHENWSVSKTLEYAYDDWCIAMFAKDLGKQEDFEYFLNRSKNWKNLYNTKNTWLQPKNSQDGFIYPFIPKEYTPYFCESNAWQYYWSVQQDIPGLIEATGGPERFTQKLDSMFSLKPVEGDKLPIFSTGMIGQYAHGNEPSHHVAYLYNYVGQPSKTQELVKKIREEQYRNEPNGHCGNEDCGQMSSWFILSALGIYPVNPAQGILDLGAPMFEEATITLPKGRSFTIKGQNLNDQNKYVKAVYLNEKRLDRWFITYDEIMEGGTLVFEMTNLPVDNEGIDHLLPEPNKVY